MVSIHAALDTARRIWTAQDELRKIASDLKTDSPPELHDVLILLQRMLDRINNLEVSVKD